MIIISWITTFASEPLKNPINEPTDARKASFVERFWISSVTKTATNGTTRIPNGGTINEPTITATAATCSPRLEPPYF